MTRVKLQLPSYRIFSTQLSVRITDINYGNHLGNDSLVGLIQEVRVRWLNSLGYSELDVVGAGLIMADLAVEYKLEGLYADTLTVTIYVGEVTTFSFELFYSLINQNNMLVAKAKTGMVCYDYESKKIVTIPVEFKRQLLPS